MALVYFALRLPEYGALRQTRHNTSGSQKEKG